MRSFGFYTDRSVTFFTSYSVVKVQERLPAGPPADAVLAGADPSLTTAPDASGTLVNDGSFVKFHKKSPAYRRAHVRCDIPCLTWILLSRFRSNSPIFFCFL